MSTEFLRHGEEERGLLGPFSWSPIWIGPVTQGTLTTVSRTLDTSIMLHNSKFNTTFCHSLNLSGCEKRLYKVEDLVDCQDWIRSTFAGADAFVILIGGNDVTDEAAKAESFAQTLLNLCWSWHVDLTAGWLFLVEQTPRMGENAFRASNTDVRASPTSTTCLCQVWPNGCPNT